VEHLTGGVTSNICSFDILDKNRFWMEQLSKVNQGFLFSCFLGIVGPSQVYPQLDPDNGLFFNHAYSIMKAIEMDGKRLVLLRNPWGRREWSGPWCKNPRVLRDRLIGIT